MSVRFDGAIDLSQIAPTRNPASGRNFLYPKSDNKWYTRNSSGVEELVGPSAGGGGGPEIYYQNTPIVTDAAGVNFFGNGVTVVNDGVGNATVTIVPFAPQYGSSAATAVITPNGTANSTITGLSNVINCVAGATYEATIYSTVTFSGSQVNIIEVLIDGNPDATGRQLIQAAAATGYRANGASSWPITGLSAGNHTFTARTRNTATGTNAAISSVHTVMTVQRVA